MNELNHEANPEGSAGKAKDGAEAVVNGEIHAFETATVSYEQLVSLAYPTPPAPDTHYTVTYRKAKEPNHEGSLAPGQWIELKKKGTIVNVKTTNRS